MPITVTRPAAQTVDADLQKAVDMRLGMESRQGPVYNGTEKIGRTYLYLSGQGGNENAGTDVDRNLRERRGQTLGDAGTDGSRKEAGGRPGGILSGYDRYSNDVQRGQAPRLIRTSARQRWTFARWKSPRRTPNGFPNSRAITFSIHLFFTAVEVNDRHAGNRGSAPGDSRID